MKHERRTARGLEVRQKDGMRVVRLRPIVPNTVDDYKSVFLPATFDASLAERMPTLAWGHNWQDPIGRAVDWGTDGDLRWIDFRVDDPALVPSAARALAQIESGTIDDVSVGFSGTQRRDPTDMELERWPGAREVIERADLDEVSLVLRGAVPGAKVLSLRSREGRVASVAEDVVMDVARKVAAGELTEDEGRAYLDLMATDAPELPPTTDPNPVPDTVDVDQALAEADAAINGDPYDRSR
jgi:HK97 family phage prohead protease